MNNQYYKFQERYVFNDKGQLCYLSGEDIYAETLDRGDGVITTLKIDLFTGDINEVLASFENTYIKDMKIKRQIGTVHPDHLIKITEGETRNILRKGGLSVSALLKK